MRYLLASLLFAGCASAGSEAEQGIVDAKKQEIDAPRLIDAPVGTPIDAAIDAPIVIDAPAGGPPDTCAQAQNITAGAMGATGITVAGNTTGYANDIQPPNNCSGFIADGPDAIYAITVTAGNVITASLTATWDSSIELTSNCTLMAACLTGQDDGDPETLTYTATAAATLYVIVDSWDVGAFGAYSLNVKIQ